MKPLSHAQSPLILRTDFSNDAVWKQICRILDQPTLEGYDDPMTYVNDREYEGISIAQVFSIIPAAERSELVYIFIVDATTIAKPKHPLLLLDMIGDPGYVKPGRYTRIDLEWVRDVAMQFSIGNMDIDDFLPDDFDHEAYEEE